MRQSIVYFLAIVAWVFGTALAHAESIYFEDLKCENGKFGLILPADLRDVKRLSADVIEKTVDVEEWPGYQVTWKHLNFDGLALVVTEFSNDPARYMLVFAMVDDPKWNAISPFKIMQPTSEAVALLGEVALDNPELARAYENEGSKLTIQSNEGRVTKVIYNCFPG